MNSNEEIKAIKERLDRIESVFGPVLDHGKKIYVSGRLPKKKKLFAKIFTPIARFFTGGQKDAQ